MNTLGDIFSSKARTEVLRVLNEVSTGVGIRQLARLAGVHPHSVERVLKKLIEEDLVMLRHPGTRCCYTLNTEHEDALIISAALEAGNAAAIARKAESLHTRAGSLLPFINEASRMLSKLRR